MLQIQLNRNACRHTRLPVWVAGPENSSGLQLEVYRLDDEVYADVAFDERHIGAPGLAHGGAIAAACDDLLGFTLWIAGTPAVTRNLAIEYLAPVPLQVTSRGVV